MISTTQIYWNINGIHILDEKGLTICRLVKCSTPHETVRAILAQAPQHVKWLREQAAQCAEWAGKGSAQYGEHQARLLTLIERIETGQPILG